MAEPTNSSLIAAQKQVLDRLWDIQNKCHPECALCIACSYGFPVQATEALNNFLNGFCTQIMVKRGPLLVVHYTPNYNVQCLFDAYSYL